MVSKVGEEESWKEEEEGYISVPICIYTMYIFLVATLAAESAPVDEVHERAVSLATTVYCLEETDKGSVQYVPIHENTAKVVHMGLFDTKKVIIKFLISDWAKVGIVLPSQMECEFLSEYAYILYLHAC